MDVDEPSSTSVRTRFSLSTMMLVTLASVCAFGWFATARQSADVRAQLQRLEREVEAYRSGLPQIDVVDGTKVHALGLDGAGWLMYFPRNRYVIHGYVGPFEGDDLQGPFPSAPLSTPLELNGLLELDARIANDGGRKWTLEFGLAGQVFRRVLPWPDSSAHAEFDRFQVAPGQRAVWEPGEPLTLMAQQLVGENRQRGDVAAIWIEPFHEGSARPTEDVESTAVGGQP